MGNVWARFAARIQNVGKVFAQTRRNDPRAVPLMAAAGLGVLLVFAVIGVLLNRPVLLTLLGILVALTAAMQVFSLRASRAAMASLSGRTGAAGAVLSQLRRPWQVFPAVSFNRRQDFVHLAVGRPGVLLVGEGAPAGAAALLKQERRRIARAAGEVTVHEVNVGEGHGQLSLRRLQRHIMTLPKELKKDEVEALANRLRVLGSSRLPMPKGPIPRAPRGRRA
ncbi:MAG: DUF4191 family protein [Nitriliruptorales bacterium]|nr:DUF4191 family protein [Nitriliruptorales bacterium]